MTEKLTWSQALGENKRQVLGIIVRLPLLGSDLAEAIF